MTWVVRYGDTNEVVATAWSERRAKRKAARYVRSKRNAMRKATLRHLRVERR